MPTNDDFQSLYDRIGALRERLAELLAPQLIGNPELADMITRRVEDFLAASIARFRQYPDSPDDGLANLIGLGTGAVSNLDDNFIPAAEFVYDDTVTTDQIRAVADLYYIYQHDRIGVFKTVLELQKRFNAGLVRLADDDGAYGLYRFDRRKVLRYSRKDIQQAYRRVFGYLPNVTLSDGAKANNSFHRLFTNFNQRVAQFYRDQRISTVIRDNGRDPNFGSIAIVRRAGLDLRNNLKNVSYGHIQVMVIELWNLLNEAFRILSASDIRSLYGANNAWEVIEEVARRHRNRPQLQASQRNRMAINGRRIMYWLSQPHLLNADSTEFTAMLNDIGDRCEEWLINTQSLGMTNVVRPSTNGRRNTQESEMEFDLFSLN